MKIALGFDCHKIKTIKNSFAFFAGCKILTDYSVVAHSDGDVVYHAIADAISSVFLHKSIGEIFPDTDPDNKDKNSAEFVKKIYEMANFPKIINLNAIIIAQSPMLSAFCPQFEKNISSLLNTDPLCVSVRAKRREDDVKKISCLVNILFE